MKLKKEHIGSYFAIRFIDHCIVVGSDVDEPMLIEAVGRLEKVGRKHIVLHSWTPLTANSALRQDNSERSILLVSAIKEVIRLQPVEDK